MTPLSVPFTAHPMCFPQYLSLHLCFEYLCCRHSCVHTAGYLFTVKEWIATLQHWISPCYSYYYLLVYVLFYVYCYVCYIFKYFSSHTFLDFVLILIIQISP